MKPEQELLQIALEWDEAIVSNDVQAISRYMSDDWVCVGTEGGIIKRESFLGNILNGDLTHYKMETQEARVKIYGDAGIVTAKGISAGHYKTAPFEFYEWSTSVFTKKEGTWKCVHTMLTPAIKDK